MTNIQAVIKKYFTHISFGIAILFFLLAGVSFFFTKQVGIAKVVNHIVVHHSIKPTLKVDVSPTTVLGVATQNNSQVNTLTNTPIPVQNNQTNNPTPTPNPSTSSGSSTTQSNKVTLQISEPDGNFSYSLDLPGGSSPCSILNNAKAAGDIKSVTIQHYGAPLNSDYVKEINGYVNGWNFSLNGTQEPKGCSNYSLNSGDTVSWKFSN